MARGDLLCPIDNTVLGLPNWQTRGNSSGSDLEPQGGHVHIFFAGTFTCSNGHRWRAASGSDLMIERIV